MANITKIKAKEEPTKKEKVAKAKKETKPKKEAKKVFILFRPFVALGRYFRDSWREIRQVRWPNRRATWKMVLAVFVYTALFVVLISLLDLFFTWLFSLIIK
ncbi:preprotein translocase subunit SecE [Candidatus Saccharibacteria bacterium]|nr:preprotein translocase subunit SecE [Candidatus Saccharibacteria bacterium]